MMPMESLPVSKVDMKCRVLGKEFSNPIFLGSGSLDETIEKVHKFLATNVGAVVPRTTRFEYAPGRNKHPSPHLDIQQKSKAMRNAEWTGYPIDYWRPFLEEVSRERRIIMSVSGRDTKGCAQVCKELDAYEFPFLEINISCAHSNETNGFITRNGDHIKSVIREIKDTGVKTPIAIKLGHSDYIVKLAQIAEEAGADGIVAINTYGPVLDFDISSGTPELTLGIAGGKGGLSGKPIFQIALTDVADISRHLKIPVIASGGVSTSEDVIKMIMAGACAVQVYTAAHLRGDQAPKYLNKLVSDVEAWLACHGYMNVNNVRGLVLPKLAQDNQMTPMIPQLSKELCIGCSLCEIICNEPDSIQMTASDMSDTNKPGLLPVIHDNVCIGCGACVTVCPTDALGYK